MCVDEFCMFPQNMHALTPLGNFHKWMLVPRSCGFIFTHPSFKFSIAAKPGHHGHGHSHGHTHSHGHSHGHSHSHSHNHSTDLGAGDDSRKVSNGGATSRPWHTHVDLRCVNVAFSPRTAPGGGTTAEAETEASAETNALGFYSDQLHQVMVPQACNMWDSQRL